MSEIIADTLAPRINDNGRSVEIQTLVKSGYDIVGFEDINDSVLTFDVATRTITIAPAVENYSVYWNGKKHIINKPLSLKFNDVSGSRYVYLDPEEMMLVEGQNNIDVRRILCAYIKYNAVTQQLVVQGDERHSADRDLVWHLNQHQDVGLIWRTGGDSQYELLNVNTSFKITGGAVLADEGLVHTVMQGLTDEPYVQDVEGGMFETLLLDGDTLRIYEPTGVPYKFNPVSNVIQYNKVTGNTGVLEDVPNNNYVNAFVLGTNCARSPIKIVVGRMISENVDDLQEEQIDQFGMPLAEYVFMYQIILMVDTSLTNDGKCKIHSVYKSSVATGKGVSSSSSGVSDHGALFGRGDPGSHPITAITGLRDELDTKVDRAYGKELSDQNYTAAEKAKLSTLHKRENHTGTQPLNTIAGLEQAILDTKDPVYTITKSLKLTQDWINTGISSSDLPSGFYGFTVHASNHAVGGQLYDETFSGVIQWFSSGTNNTNGSEVILHSAGQSNGAGNIYIKTIRTMSGRLHLQIASALNTTGVSTYTFTFRRLL